VLIKSIKSIHSLKAYKIIYTIIELYLIKQKYIEQKLGQNKFREIYHNKRKCHI